MGLPSEDLGACVKSAFIELDVVAFNLIYQLGRAIPAERKHLPCRVLCDEVWRKAKVPQHPMLTAQLVLLSVGQIRKQRILLKCEVAFQTARHIHAATIHLVFAGSATWWLDWHHVPLMAFSRIPLVFLLLVRFFLDFVLFFVGFGMRPSAASEVKLRGETTT